jgi:hypothetical protein
MSDWDLNNPDFIRAFNAVTAWVTLRIGYACGIRAVTTPLPWARDILPVYGVTKWSDKDNPFGSHSRILWVPDDVRLELGAYQLLRHAFRTELLMYSRPPSKEMLRPVIGGSELVGIAV